MRHGSSFRKRQFDRLASEQFDVIIIGAGINGSGIARDAALRGLNVLLLERGDIGEGTTAWSTRLIHGGLRYLEHYEFHLVRESLRERELLFQNAPHLVRPLPFIVPIYQNGKRPPWLVQLGMLGYDTLSFDRSVPGHTMLNTEETIERIPGLNSNGLSGAASYYDGQVTFPERIALENALSAIDHGACLLTYTRVDRLHQLNNRVGGVTFTDLLDPDQTEHTVYAPLTVNVTGPWVDQVAGEVAKNRMIGGTKGSHIIVERFPGAPNCAIYVENESDARPYFIVPWNDLYLIGTTDFRYTGDLDAVIADDEEIDYLIADTNRVIPEANLTRQHVLYTYSGVRPLPHVEEGDEAAITRQHIVHDHGPELHGLISIIGGKLTTYRNLAELATDLVMQKLGRPDPGCSTNQLPLPGGNTVDFQKFVAEFRVWSDLNTETADRLISIYGTLGRTLIERFRSDPDMLKPIPGTGNTIQGEIPFALDYEAAQTLTDVLMRRTMLGLNADNAVSILEPVAAIAAKHQGWDTQRRQQEIDDYLTYLERFRAK